MIDPFKDTMQNNLIHTRQGTENINIANTESVTILPIAVLIATCPYMIGLFQEWTCSLISIWLCFALAYYWRNTNERHVPTDPVAIAVYIISIAFLVSPLWAVDHGMAVFGFVKFYPTALFVILLKVSSKFAERKGDYLKYLPTSMAVMTVTSYLLSLYPPLKDMLLVRGRLAGFTEYPNTYAILLLVSSVLILWKDNVNKRDYAVLFILFAGIVLSGSRTVFILWAIVLLLFIVRSKSVKLKVLVGSTSSVIVLGALLYAGVTGNFDTVARFVTASLNSSTFVGRLLYYKDAIPYILGHPFGTGYYGYYFAQGSFQTGVYSIVHIHNDLLQILLDIGWIPCAASAFALAKRLPKLCEKELIAASTLVLHSLFDFNLQLVAVDLILLALLFDPDGKDKKVRSYRMPLIALTVVSLCTLYFALSSLLFYAGRYDQSARLYPGNTMSQIMLLTRANEAEEMERIADVIIAHNKSCSIAYSAKARVQYSRGDFLGMIENKTRALGLLRYQIDEYIDYFNMLDRGVGLYIEAGDEESAVFLMQKIVGIENMLERVKAGTSALAYKINDIPQLDLPEDYQETIDYYRLLLNV